MGAGAFGQVIPLVGTLNGFLGEISRVGGGDPFVVSKIANNSNAANINFGDAVVLLPDSVGGSYKQFADWQANGGGLAVLCATASSVTITPTSLNGLSQGMLVFGANITAGTYITAINNAAGTITVSKAATTTNGSISLSFASFAGFAVRQVKTQQPYSAYTPAPSQMIGNYGPGQYVGVLVKGGISVKVLVGTPVAGGPVYIRTILNGGIPAGIVGGLEANSDTVNSNYLGGGTPALAECFFKTGTIDTNFISEVSILSRVQV